MYPMVGVALVTVWSRAARSAEFDLLGQAAIAGAVVAMVWQRMVTAREADLAARWAVGASGEEATAELLDRWVASPAGRARSAEVFHDVRIAGRSENIDHLVIDRAGVALIETKRWTGEVVVGRHVWVTGRLGGATRRRRERRDDAIAQIERLGEAMTRLLHSRVDGRRDLDGRSTARLPRAGFVCIHGASVRPAWYRRRAMLRGVAVGGPDDLERWMARRRRSLSTRRTVTLQRAVAGRLERAGLR